MDRLNVNKGIQSLSIADLRAGDRLVIRTSNSTYEFWVEYPDHAIGVLRGGSTRTPTRVRVAAENASTFEAPVEPLRVGERARVVLLGPQGVAVRGFVTSTIAAIYVDRHDRVAA